MSSGGDQGQVEKEGDHGGDQGRSGGASRASQGGSGRVIMRGDQGGMGKEDQATKNLQPLRVVLEKF